MADARQELGESLQLTLREAARTNELRMAWVRVVALALANTLDWVAALHPSATWGRQPGLQLPLLTDLWLLYAVGLLVFLLRGAYSDRLRTLAPALDGVIVATTSFNGLLAYGVRDFAVGGPLHGISSVACVLAASGGLRLRTGSAWLTTGMALATYGALGFGAAPYVTPYEVTYNLAMIFVTGLLGVRMTEVVQRSVQDEVGRQMLERFLPGRVVREAYRDPLALLTEPRSLEATVLVSDLRGFTAFSEKLAPAEVLAFLNELQGAFAAAVREQGGTVDKFMGDGMLAVFGAPEPLADHADRAVHAAQAMRGAVARFNAARPGAQPVRIGVGIHSGPVVTGCLGAGARLEFTVIGDTVNSASRLEALTKDKGVDVLVSGETARRLADPAALEALGEVTLRGRQEPLAVHRLAA